MKQLKNSSVNLPVKNGKVGSTLLVTQESKKNQTILTGLLTSRIESRKDYYYGFFGIEGYEAEIPVIFKNQRWSFKPLLPKNSLLELKGSWANSKGERLSFTCSDYEVIQEPKPFTISDLQKQISSLLRPALEKKKSWAETTDFLFRKKKDLEEIQAISKLGANYLQAYLLTKQVFYANYQTEHLEQANFSLPSYLDRIASELDLTKRQMLASGWKEVKGE